ncbi:unnamed protein product [Protopolystoma xenopodis]|uniref:Uncharacterized protein n=1 Tax=Protopolystoma xenopodis TaxID=117903 RepID=A0A448XBR8_9PLAT|nr:unnamed protein product [Protopolystoma xenopodis]
MPVTFLTPWHTDNPEFRQAIRSLRQQNLQQLCSRDHLEFPTRPGALEPGQTRASQTGLFSSADAVAERSSPLEARAVASPIRPTGRGTSQWHPMERQLESRGRLEPDRPGPTNASSPIRAVSTPPADVPSRPEMRRQKGAAKKEEEKEQQQEEEEEEGEKEEEEEWRKSGERGQTVERERRRRRRQEAGERQRERRRQQSHRLANQAQYSPAEVKQAAVERTPPVSLATNSDSVSSLFVAGYARQGHLPAVQRPRGAGVNITESAPRRAGRQTQFEARRRQRQSDRQRQRERERERGREQPRRGRQEHAADGTSKGEDGGQDGNGNSSTFSL